MIDIKKGILFLLLGFIIVISIQLAISFHSSNIEHRTLSMDTINSTLFINTSRIELGDVYITSWSHVNKSGGSNDGNATPIQITNIIYNGTGIKLIQAFNGTLAKDRNLIKNNTLNGKWFFNNSIFMNKNFTFLNSNRIVIAAIRIRDKGIRNSLNITNGTGQHIIGFLNNGNFTFKVYNRSVGQAGGLLNCAMRVKNNGSWGMVCSGRGEWSGWKAK